MSELNNYGKTSIFIREAFGQAWFDGPYNDIRILWSNEGKDFLRTEYWLQFLINDGDAQVITMGENPRYRHFGIISIQIFSPTDEKDIKPREIADFISKTFKEIKHEQLYFKPATFKDIGSEDNWYQFNMSIEFQRESLGE